MLIFACAAAGACQPRSELAIGPDCKIDDAKLKVCWNKYKNQAYAFISNCVPYSKPERIAGTWSRDFEWNQFYEGRELPPNEAFRLQDPSVDLLAPSTGDLPRNSSGQLLATAVYIEFIGRRPLCDLTPGYRTVLIDSMISERTISVVPSAWSKPPPN